MPLFDNMLHSDQTLFKDEDALDYSYIPKLIPYREVQQKYAASCISPLFQKRNGKNILIYGPPGVGKTVACLHLFKELEEKTDEIIPIYINCWEKDTTFKILLEICNKIGYKLVQNKNKDDLFIVVEKELNKNAAVFCFDEIDKAEDFDFLYMILEKLLKKTIILITNYKSCLEDIDERVLSRLMPEQLEFKPYSLQETKGILKERAKYAFIPKALAEDALDIISKKSFELKDMRCGLNLMKESALIAENSSSKQINSEHAQEALKKIGDFKAKSSSSLKEEEQKILDLIKENSGKKIGELYKLFLGMKGNLTYKSFQRKLKRLCDGGFVSLLKTEGGAEGNTTIVSYLN